MALPISQLQGIVESPLQKALSGYSQGQQEGFNRQQQAIQSQQLQVKQARNMEIQGALRQLANNPNVQDSDYARIMTQFPELSEQLKAPMEALSKEEQESTKNQALSVYTAVRGGNVEMGKRLLDQYAQAARNGGDEDKANLLDALGSTLESNPDAYKTQSGLMLSAIMGGEEFAELMAKADERSDPLTREGIEAETGLTKARINKVKAETRGLGVEVQKKALEFEKLKRDGIPIDPKEKFGFEKDLRNDYNKLTGDFFKVQDSWRKIEQVSDTAAGDMSLIFSYMKILDPGSTVREGEFANAQNATGWTGMATNLYNRALTGNRVNAKQRAQFKAEAKGLFAAAAKREKDVRKQLAPAIKNYGLNADNVFGEIEAVPDSDRSIEELEAELAELEANG